VPIFPLPQIALCCGKLTLVGTYYSPQTMSICGKLVIVAIHNLPQTIFYLWQSLYLPQKPFVTGFLWQNFNLLQNPFCGQFALYCSKSMCHKC